MSQLRDFFVMRLRQSGRKVVGVNNSSIDEAQAIDLTNDGNGTSI
jgi:hypothetical protein